MSLCYLRRYVCIVTVFRSFNDAKQVMLRVLPAICSKRRYCNISYTALSDQAFRARRAYLLGGIFWRCHLRRRGIARRLRRRAASMWRADVIRCILTDMEPVCPRWAAVGVPYREHDITVTNGRASSHSVARWPCRAAAILLAPATSPHTSAYPLLRCGGRPDM